MNAKFFLILKRLYVNAPPVVQKIMRNYKYRKDTKSAIRQFLSKKEYDDYWLRKRIVKDIYHCWKDYCTSPEEFFLFGFREMKSEKRETFLPDWIKDQTLINLIGLDVMNRELKDKYNFYKILGEYFKRDVMLLPTGGGRLLEFKEFAIKHGELFIKSNCLSKGQEAGLYKVSSEKEAEELYAKLVAKKMDWIVEEKIVQVKETAQWNESSVNTVRLPAILNDDKWTPIGPFFRTGRVGSVVDNAGSGGVFACIDPQSGVITSRAIDEFGTYYDMHPDSQLVFKGWQVPRWKELLALAEEVHKHIPHHKYVGWDFALTEKGWILIEGNWGQFVTQYINHEGLKKQFLELLGTKQIR